MLCAIILSLVKMHVATLARKRGYPNRFGRVSDKTRAKVTRVDISMGSSLACRDGQQYANYDLLGKNT